MKVDYSYIDSIAHHKISPMLVIELLNGMRCADSRKYIQDRQKVVPYLT